MVRDTDEDCCELLSNHYLCANKNSYLDNFSVDYVVVNCFQIIIFALTRTAFTFVNVFTSGCELLSNHYLCANKNSIILLIYWEALVVNCFQIIIFALTRTASECISRHLCRL